MHRSDQKQTQATDLPSVLIISNVLLYREGVASGLMRSGILAVAGIASIAEAPITILERRPDAVLLDASFPDSLKIVGQLRLLIPNIPIVGFGISGGESSEFACAEAGLVGFVGCEGTIADLAQTVLHALGGEVHCSPRLVALLCYRVAAIMETGIDVSARLTRREREIAGLISDGLSNKEIAIELKVGPATVKNHVHNILEKLHVTRRSAVSAKLASHPAAHESTRISGMRRWFGGEAGNLSG